MKEVSEAKKPAPAVATRARDRAGEAFDSKISALEELVVAKRSGEGPRDTTPTGFIEWEDVTLGVATTTRSTYYDKHSIYKTRREKVDKLLKRLKGLRTVPRSRKESREVKAQRDKATEALKTAQAYIDQYSTVRTLLDDANRRIRAQEAELVRLRQRLRTVVPLKEA